MEERTHELSRGKRRLSFCSDLIRRALDVLRSGESCSLVGVGSSGKSNIARHMARHDVLAYHLGPAAAACLSVLVNCTDLAEYTPAALHTLMLDALLRALRDAPHSPYPLTTTVTDLRDQAIASAARARINLKDAFAEIFRAGFDQLFILLDDFDHVVQHAPSATLNSLRSFRDDHKRRLMYVTFTRRELAYLREEAEFQELYELMASHTIAIGPYADDDARSLVQELSAQWGIRGVSQAAVEALLAWSGNHPGLLRAAMTALRHDPSLYLGAPNALSRLQSNNVDVLPECERIWESLEVEEQAVLAALARGLPAEGDALRPLEAKGVIHKPSGRYVIRSPIFAAFVASQSLPARRPFEFDPTRDAVQINGHVISGLSPVERHLLRRIRERHPRPATRTELLAEMLEHESSPRPYSGNPEARLAQYLLSLQRRLDSVKPGCLRIDPTGSCQLVL